MRIRNKIYVGYFGANKGEWEIFRSPTIPTFNTHGDKYLAVIGPFRTIWGAKVMTKYGYMNPHCQCVADAEKLAKVYKNEL